MFDYQALYDTLREAKADAWAELLPIQIAQAFDTAKHGDFAKWQALIDH